MSLDLDGRWKVIRSKGLCRTCLIPHRLKECGIDGCRLHHHALLHTPAASNVAADHRVALQTHHSTLNICLFRYVPVTLENDGKKVETFAFLGDGCQTTLMEAGLATELGIYGPTESLWLGWTGNISREEKGSQRVNVNISGRGMNNKFKLSNVRTVQQLKLQGQTLNYDEIQKRYPYMRGLPLYSYVNATPRIIIGVEHVQLLTTLKA